MEGKTIRQRCSSALACLLILCLGLSPSAALGRAVLPSQNPGCTVRVEPAVQSAEPGQQFTVNVTVDGVVDLGAFQFDMTFDPAVVTAAHVELSSFPASTDRTVQSIGAHIDDEIGRVSFGAFSFGDAAGPNGTGPLAVVTFTAAGPGTSALNLENVIVTDTVGNALAISVEGGVIIVAVPTPTLTATVRPTATPSAVSTPTSTATATSTQPTPTATATAVDQKTETPTASPVVAATATSVPTHTPEVTPRPTTSPTATLPSPAETPEPSTATPAVTASATATQAATGTPTAPSLATTTATPTTPAIPTPTGTSYPASTRAPLPQATLARAVSPTPGIVPSPTPPLASQPFQLPASWKAALSNPLWWLEVFLCILAGCALYRLVRKYRK
jgi:hypothetical protein